MTPTTDLTLSTLLDEGISYAPEYGGGLSNHLPMALVALHRIGAPYDRLAGFAAAYAARLQPLASRPPLESPVRMDDWRHSLGKFDRYAALLGFFRDQLRDHGPADVLRATLPSLMPGVGAAAFHGLIRTAYGLECGHPDEIAAGLAYWACRYLPLIPNLPDEGRYDAVSEWITRITAVPSGLGSICGLIYERMQRVAEVDEFARDAGRLHTDAATLGQLAKLALERYLASRDFTVLHLMTSCHALRVLMPYVDDPTIAVRWYAVAFAAGVAASGVDIAATPIACELLPWEKLADRARCADGDHVAKFVYTCKEEARTYGDDAYRRAATLAVDR